MARSWADIGVGTQLTNRQHVRVRPVSGLRILSPTGSILELVLNADGKVRVANPKVPDVVRYAPHLGKVRDFSMMLDGGWSRRETQHNVATAALNRQLDLPNFAGFVWMVSNAVHLQEIDAPGCVLTKERVVPCLASSGILGSPACGVPRAGVILVGGILRFESRTLDWQIVQNTFTRNAADDVHAELETLCMDRLREFLETCVSAILQGGRETLGHGNKSAILIHRVLEQVRLGPVLRVDHIPAFVDDGIVIAERLQ